MRGLLRRFDEHPGVAALAILVLMLMPLAVVATFGQAVLFSATAPIAALYAIATLLGIAVLRRREGGKVEAGLAIALFLVLIRIVAAFVAPLALPPSFDVGFEMIDGVMVWSDADVLSLTAGILLVSTVCMAALCPLLGVAFGPDARGRGAVTAGIALAVTELAITLPVLVAASSLLGLVLLAVLHALATGVLTATALLTGALRRGP